MHTASLLNYSVRRTAVAERQRTTEVEPLDHFAGVHAVEDADEDVANCGPNEIARHNLGALQFAFVFELELAGDRRQCRVHVRDARHDDLLAVGERSSFSVRDHEFQRADGQALTHAGSLVDLAIGTCLKRDLFDHFAHVLGNFHSHAAWPVGEGFLPGDGQGVVPRGRIVRSDLGANPVLERRDDLAAGRVVFRVRGEHEHDVELQPNGIALDLHIPFLEDVEESHLNLAREIGQFVDGEDAAVRARQQPIVHGEFVGEIQTALRGLDRIDVANHVGNRHVRRRELLDVAVVTWHPHDGQRISFGPDARTAGSANRIQRVVVNFASGDDGDVLVEQIDEATKDATLRLSAESEQDEVVSRQNRVHQLGDNGVFVADHAREQTLASL